MNRNLPQLGNTAATFANNLRWTSGPSRKKGPTQLHHRTFARRSVTPPLLRIQFGRLESELETLRASCGKHPLRTHGTRARSKLAKSARPFRIPGRGLSPLEATS